MIFWWMVVAILAPVHGYNRHDLSSSQPSSTASRLLDHCPGHSHRLIEDICTEHCPQSIDPTHIIRLIKKVVTVSVETVGLVEGMI
jgi:hypothetical protein